MIRRDGINFMLNKESFNFAFIGAGSTSFTLSLVSDILYAEDFIKGGELRLVDIDPVFLEESFEAEKRWLRVPEEALK
jgi:alpha-galactosidase/6-phospho-beta-glucosidase family protein